MSDNINLPNVLAKCRAMPTDVQLVEFIHDLAFYNPNPPYQRSDIWKLPFKQRLITSIFYGIPIGFIHLAPWSALSQKYFDSSYLETSEQSVVPTIPPYLENTTLHKYILDGKQRICAIRSFMGNNDSDSDNQFSIKIKDEKGKDHVVKYEYLLAARQAGEKDLEQIKNGLKPTSSPKEIFFQKLYHKFDHYRMYIVNWDNNKIEDQCAIFTAINYSKELSTEESMYCPNFLTRMLLEYVFKIVDKHLHNYLELNVKSNSRMKGVRFCHNVCFLCFGQTFNDEFCIRDITKIPLAKSARCIQKELLKLEISEITPEVLEDMGIDSNLKILDQCCKILARAIEHDPKTGGSKDFCNTIKRHNFIDMLGFMIQNCQLKYTSINKLKENIPVLHKLLDSLIEEKRIDPAKEHQSKLSGRDGSSTKKYGLDLRNKFLNNKANVLGLLNDERLKNPISDTDKTLVRLRSDGKCEMCKIPLTDKSIRHDHVFATSKSSSTYSGLLCDICNDEIKRDLSPSQIIDLSDYFKKKDVLIASS